MTDKLPQSVFDSLPPIAINQQIHVNHDKCPAGRDDRQRLYIKRVGPAAFVAHCFNCGGSGYRFNGGGATHRTEDLMGHRENPTKLRHSPATGLKLTDALPIHVQEYLLKYRINPEEAVRVLGYKYHQTSDSLCMPLYQDNETSGVVKPHSGRGQLRRMHDASTPRYTTFNNGSTDKMFGLVANFSPITINPTIVIVEDQISAYRVFRDSDYCCDAMALLGTNLSPDAISCLSLRQHKTVIIWLDDDAAGKSAAVTIWSTLKPLLPDAQVLQVINKQPKDLQVDELKKVLDHIKVPF